jgi:sugar lactone lactonase YvrE
MKPSSRFAAFTLCAVLTSLLVACGGSSSSASVNSSTSISGLALDAAGTTLLVANTGAEVVETLNPTLASPVVTTLAGAQNQAGTAEGTTTQSAGRFNNPVSITEMGGDYYVTDTGNSGIRKLTAAGVISNVAGRLGSLGSTDGTGSGAYFYFPKGIANDGTYLYVTDTYNHTIRQVTTAGVVTTIAGYAGSPGTANGTGSTARFNTPYGVAVDPACGVAGACDLYVSDDANHAIRIVTTAGVVTTLAGTVGTSGSANGTGTAAKFYGPAGIVTDGTDVYVADSGNHLIRKVVIATGAVTTVAGTAGTAGNTDATGTAAKFSFPTGLALDAANGILYVSDQNYTKVRKIVLSTGVVTTLNASF